MDSGRRQIFVYYRIASGYEGSVVREVLSRQAALMRETPGLVARLLMRPAQAGEEGAPRTMMETYVMDARASAEGVGIELQARIESLMAEATASAIDGVRHIEVFEACA